MTTVRIAGFRVELNNNAVWQTLQGDDGPVAADILRRTIRVESAAKRLCPVDTGRLRASITHGLARDDAGIFGWVGTDVEYAPYVELGTSRMAARPYLRPALAEALGVPA